MKENRIVRSCYYSKSIESFDNTTNGKLHILDENQVSTICGKIFTENGRWVIDKKIDIDKITCRHCVEKYKKIMEEL